MSLVMCNGKKDFLTEYIIFKNWGKQPHFKVVNHTFLKLYNVFWEELYQEIFSVTVQSK